MSLRDVIDTVNMIEFELNGGWPAVFTKMILGLLKWFCAGFLFALGYKAAGVLYG